MTALHCICSDTLLETALWGRRTPDTVGCMISQQKSCKMKTTLPELNFIHFHAHMF